MCGEHDRTLPDEFLSPLAEAGTTTRSPTDNPEVVACGPSSTTVSADLLRALEFDGLGKLSRDELAEVDLTQISEDLQPAMVACLGMFRLFDRLMGWVPQLLLRPELDWGLVQAARAAAGEGRGELVRELLALQSDPRPRDLLPFAVRVAADGLVPGPMLDLLEARAADDLDSLPGRIAVDLLHTPQTLALGILVGRGAVAAGGDANYDVLSDFIAMARAQLGLPHEDPVLMSLESERAQRDQLAAQLATAAHTIRDLRGQLAHALQQASERESELVAVQRRLDAVTSIPPPAIGENVLRDLRRKNRELVHLTNELKARLRAFETDVSIRRCE